MNKDKVKAGDVLVGKPVNRNYFDRDGVLLLRQGEIVQSPKQLEMLLNRGLFYTINQQHSQSSEPAVLIIQSPFELLSEIQEELKAMFLKITDGTTIDKFHENIMRLCKKLQQSCKQDADATIGNILLDQQYKYYVRHPVHVAILCEMVSQQHQWTEQERLPLLAAALTMNIGMLSIQEKLFHQKETLTDEQKQTVREHMKRGVKILTDLGVIDTVWIEGVGYHHEAVDGSGYAEGLTGDAIPLCAKIISVGDQICAGVSSRSYRSSLLCQEPMKDIYLRVAQKTDQDVLKLYIRLLGVHPPGTIVKLANGEIAVVTHRSDKVHIPIVHSVVKANNKGMFLSPMKRDCSNSEYAVQGAAYDEREKISINRYQLWGYSNRTSC